LLLHFLAQLESQLLAGSVVVLDLLVRCTTMVVNANTSRVEDKKMRWRTFFNFFSMISLIFCSTTRGTNISSSRGFIRYDAG
jgi:hypothetical protein